jgi:hypothetical protein
VRAARTLGVASIGIELAQGLEGPAAFAATLEEVLRLEPDRITLRTPRSSEHAAVPLQAASHGRLQDGVIELQRNLLGYSAQPSGDLIGLGVGAIGQFGAVYSQNAATFEAYRQPLRERRAAGGPRPRARSRRPAATRGLKVTALGCRHIDVIAAVFHAYRQAERQRALCSGRL